MALDQAVFKVTKAYPRDVGGPVALYEPTYYSTPGKYQAWYRVTKCGCNLSFCKAWAVVNVYNGLKAGTYWDWEDALEIAIRNNSGTDRPDPKWRIR